MRTEFASNLPPAGIEIAVTAAVCDRFKAAMGADVLPGVQFLRHDTYETD